MFYSKVSGTRDSYLVADLEGQLSNTIIRRITDTVAGSNVPFLDMAANQVALFDKIIAQLKLGFAEFGLSLTASWLKICRSQTSFRKSSIKGSA